jgi:hypothetical protein
VQLPVLTTSIIESTIETMRALKKLSLLTSFLVVGAVVTSAIYRLTPLSKRTKPLRVFITTGHGGYQAVVINRGFLPVVVGRCETISDAMEKDVTVGDVMQRLHRGDGSWENAVKRNECRLVPLGIVNARYNRTLLWPGQRLHSEWFFPNIGQYSQFHHGDTIRFIVFTHTPTGDSDGIPSPQFTIE